jgi:hypothetical protein
LKRKAEHGDEAESVEDDVQEEEEYAKAWSFGSGKCLRMLFRRWNGEGAALSLRSMLMREVKPWNF